VKLSYSKFPSNIKLSLFFIRNSPIALPQPFNAEVLPASKPWSALIFAAPLIQRRSPGFPAALPTASVQLVTLSAAYLSRGVSLTPAASLEKNTSRK